MKQQQNGLILTGLGRKDYVYEMAFGATDAVDFHTIGRDISGIPNVFQGKENTCVACCFTWVKQFQEKESGKSLDLSHEWLAQISNTQKSGATLNQVGLAAQRYGVCEQQVWDALFSMDEKIRNAAKFKIPNYFRLMNVTMESIYEALLKTPVILGLYDWAGIGPHAVVAFDIDEDGSFVCANWWKDDEQDIIHVPFQNIHSVIVPIQKPEKLSSNDVRLGYFAYIYNKYFLWLKS